MMILNKKRKTENKNIDHMMYFIRRVHDMADFYQTAGMTPGDLISSHPDFFNILKRYYRSHKDDLDINSLTWAAACSFIIFNSDEYMDIMTKISRLTWNNELTRQ